MTPRNLFNIIIKIWGLYFFKNIIETIPQVVSTSSMMAKAGDLASVPYIFLGTCVILAFYIFVSFVLIARSNKIVDLLKLDKGFNEEVFVFNIRASSILTIALIVIGGLILTNEVPNLCRALYAYVEERNLLKYDQRRPDISYSILIGSKIIIGLLLLGERKRIVSFVESKQNKNIDI